jgi:DNA-binding transcriptional ArsR family regulator
LATDHQETRSYGRLRSHPVRDLIVDAMRSYGRPVSATRLAEILGRTVGSVAYHVRQLEDAGVVSFVEKGRVQGALEHFFALASDEVDVGDRSVELQKLCDALTLPSEDGNPEVVELDETAREELQALVAAVRPKVRRVVRSAAKRSAGGSQDVAVP